MRRQPVDIVDIDGLRLPEPDPAQQTGPSGARKWIAVYWRCCSTYSRIYVNRHGTAYEGHCPTCAKKVRARIGAQGTSARFFEAD